MNGSFQVALATLYDEHALEARRPGAPVALEARPSPGLDRIVGEMSGTRSIWSVSPKSISSGPRRAKPGTPASPAQRIEAVEPAGEEPVLPGRLRESAIERLADRAVARDRVRRTAGVAGLLRLLPEIAVDADADRLLQHLHRAHGPHVDRGVELDEVDVRLKDVAQRLLPVVVRVDVGDLGVRDVLDVRGRLALARAPGVVDASGSPPSWCGRRDRPDRPRSRPPSEGRRRARRCM